MEIEIVVLRRNEEAVRKSVGDLISDAKIIDITKDHAREDIFQCLVKLAPDAGAPEAEKIARQLITSADVSRITKVAVRNFNNGTTTTFFSDRDGGLERLLALAGRKIQTIDDIRDACHAAIAGLQDEDGPQEILKKLRAPTEAPLDKDRITALRIKGTEEKHAFGYYESSVPVDKDITRNPIYLLCIFIYERIQKLASQLKLQ